jgi:hypothetical protein
MEWGVTTHLVGTSTQDKGRLDRAYDIYQRMLANTPEDTRLWWQAKYFQIRVLSDRGDYKPAYEAILNVKRTTDPEYDKGRFGFQDKYLALEAELKGKVF